MSSSTTRLEATTTPSGLITLPALDDTSESAEAGPSKPSAPQIRQDRLYVGNLHPSVDEYTLIKAFERFGKITSLDFLFHKAGPQKGKPRGYAFIEYSSKDEALKAMITMHDKLVRGRNLVVTFAHQAPSVDDPGKLGKRRVDTGRPTALSLMKTQGRLRTNDKIRVLERKLAQLEKEKPTALDPGSGSASGSSTPTQPPPTSLPAPPPTLPAKPSSTLVPAQTTATTATGAGGQPVGATVRRLKDQPPDLKTLMEMQRKEKLKKVLGR